MIQILTQIGTYIAYIFKSINSERKYRATRAKMKKQNDSALEAGSSAIGSLDIQTSIRKQFKKLRLGLSTGLIICFTVPLLVLSTYFHFQFNSTLRNSERLSLTALSESQRNTIDLFLQERVVNLFSLFHYTQLNIKPSIQEME